MSEAVQVEDERTASSVRVLLVDDHDLFRTGLRNLLEEQGVQIVGEAGDGRRRGPPRARARAGRRRDGPATCPG